MATFPILKSSETIPLKNRFCEFLSSSNDKSILTERVRNFLEILEQNYLSISKLKGCSTGQSFLSETKQISINYLHQIKLLLSKLSPSDFSSFSFNFNWTDLLSQKTITSNNIWFEYYNVMYNIGMMLYIMADNNLLQNNMTNFSLEEAKELRTQYSKALFYFDKIKSELGAKLTDNEKGIDLSDNGLDYMRCLCMMGGYIALMNASYCKFKQNMAIYSEGNTNLKENLEKNLKQRLSITIEIIYQADIAISIIKKIEGDNKHILAYLEYRKDYFKGLIEYFQYEYYNIVFEIEGETLGYALGFMKKYVEILKEMESKLPLYGNTNEQKIKNNITENDKKLQEMISTNKILRQPLNPHTDVINRTEIKIEGVDPEDNPTLEDISENDLVTIISFELRKKMNLTINELLTYLSSQLQLCFTEESIQMKLNNIEYPLSIEGTIPGKENRYIESNQLLWQKILYIQSLNRGNEITSIITYLIDKNKSMKTLLSNVINTLINDKKEDSQYRQQYGEVQWNIPLINVDNDIHFINEQINKLNDFGIKCKEFENDYLNQENTFNELYVPIEQIKIKLPGCSKLSSMILSDEENNILSIITVINQLKVSLEETKLKVQKDIKDTSALIPGFESIRNGKMNEIEFMLSQKERVNQLIMKEIKPIEMKINEKLNELALLCGKVCGSEFEIMKRKELDEDNKKFVEYYDQIAESYFKCLLKAIDANMTLVHKANTLNNGINKLYGKINNRRDLRKQTLQRILNKNIDDEVKQLEMIPVEHFDKKYNDIINDLAKLGVYVKKLARKIGELNIIY